MTLSGPEWTDKYPTSTDPNDLKEPFQGGVVKFLAALKNAGAKVKIAATLRPAERVYLMYYSFQIAKCDMHPAKVPPAKQGVDINWVHKNAKGEVDLPASKIAAQQMVDKYGIVYSPARTTRHLDGMAIDMTISWDGELNIHTADGKSMIIKSRPQTGENAELQAVALGYGLHKLKEDPPHWSADGH